MTFKEVYMQRNRGRQKKPLWLSILLGFFIAFLVFWVMFAGLDFCFVAKFDTEPLFCSKNEAHFTGMGYSFDRYPNPVTGKYEYAFYLFGHLVTSTFTD